MCNLDVNVGLQINGKAAMDCIFQSSSHYRDSVERRKVEALKLITEDFQKKGHKHLFFLDEEHLNVLRVSFQNNPICHSVLTRVSDNICVSSMFQTGLDMSSEGAFVDSVMTPQRKVLLDFEMTLKGQIQSFIRLVIRSVWIYGFVVVRDYTDETLPEVVDDDSYIIFRDEHAELYARGLDGKDVLRVVCRDIPDMNGRATSAMSYLYEKSLKLQHLQRCRDMSIRNACRQLFVIGSKDDGEACDAKRQRTSLDELDAQITQSAIQAVQRAKLGVGSSLTDVDLTTKFNILNEERDGLNNTRDRRTLVKEIEQMKTQNASLWRYLGDIKARHLFGSNVHSSLSSMNYGTDETLMDQVVENLEENRTLEASWLGIHPLDITPYIEEFNQQVRNTLIGNISFKSNIESGSRYWGGNSRHGENGSSGRDGLQKLVDACALAWQDFIVHTVLVSWIERTGIPLKPKRPKRIEDLNAIVPYIRYLRPGKGVRILSEALDIPVEDFENNFEKNLTHQ